LARADYSAAAVSGLLGLRELPAGRPLFDSLLPHLWRTRDASPLATLVRLFLLGQVVPASDVRAALQPLSVDDAVQSGLLSAVAADFRAALQIVPFQNLWIAADWPGELPDRARASVEPVMGLAASTQALAQMMISRSGGRALDLGTGSGVLALLAARHADRVWAVDLNPRAADITKLNALLNGVTNLDARTGDLFEPVSEQTFDLMVCNPPFVIGPTIGRLHSQTGRPADDFCRSLVRTAPRYLRPGGFCQLVANWVHPAGGDWRERMAGWFAGLDCDAWVLQSHADDAATYARNRVDEMSGGASPSRLFDEWMAYYDRAGIAAVGFGVITLRRTPQPRGQENWFRCDPLPGISGPCGPSIEAWFARQDFLAAHRDDGVLLAARVRRADGMIFEQRDTMTAAGWAAGPAKLRLTTGLQFSGGAEAGAADFVARCTGAAPLSAELDRLAADLGRDPREIAPAFLTVVRRLIELGILANVAP
jgi:methylase of polypeptide subunit release factors